MIKSEEQRARAETRLSKIQRQASEGAQAMAQYEAASKALIDKSAKLKALRLAKEAADLAALADRPPPVKPTPRKTARTTPAKPSATRRPV